MDKILLISKHIMPLLAKKSNTEIIKIQLLAKSKSLEQFRFTKINLNKKQGQNIYN